MVYDLRSDRRVVLTSGSFPLLLCRMDVDVADKGEAGCELTLFADC